ncbi:uncharacterized protein L969DRAFT_559125 [Mixia osmundae IAM 14324]|uniref:uncharacterized protein n=1 Tax=Mixia osmundae (strain CBS 9802 / IAM 14324 / JCM 22182 / KY 12970) TaxID=764103 RepID=UPI0004A558B7|nr:uncharacterized protein L969DRAFT_559125 [Mixia osmundae IAM 14324]KEI37975.1 hypothetical protein L969DRAFT_559125 [Mixia osmundae IAM 14324]
MVPIAKQHLLPPMPGAERLTSSNGHVSEVFHSYELRVVQHPIRARMAGFGHRDRRSLTPPLIARLFIRDRRTHELIDPATIDLSFFILAADLWSADGQRDANLVLHPSFSPTLVAPEPLPSPDAILPHLNFGSQLNLRDNSESGNIMPLLSNSQHTLLGITSAQQTLPEQQNALSAELSGWRPVLTSNGLPVHANGHVGEDGPVRPAGRARLDNSASHFIKPVDFTALTRETDEIISVRNLLGSLHANAQLLRDVSEQQGIYFILSDLSVRAEGTYKIRLVLTKLGASEQRFEFPQPLLAQASTDPFEVLSVKRFPGNLAPTELSLAFSKQGIKIPNRGSRNE